MQKKRSLAELSLAKSMAFPKRYNAATVRFWGGGELKESFVEAELYYGAAN
jgi:hypothetical protein